MEWFEEICEKLGGVYKCSGDIIMKMTIYYYLRKLNGTKGVYTPQGVLFKGGKGWMWNEIVICVGKICL